MIIYIHIYICKWLANVYLLLACCLNVRDRSKVSFVKPQWNLRDLVILKFKKGGFESSMSMDFMVIYGDLMGFESDLWWIYGDLMGFHGNLIVNGLVLLGQLTPVFKAPDRENPWFPVWKMMEFVNGFRMTSIHIMEKVKKITKPP